jgi:adenylylsulfate kinase
MNTNGAIVWLTGLSGAGKTTIANRLKDVISQKEVNVEVLDGDVIRTNLSQGLGFSKSDRDINIRRIGYVANLLSRNGVIVIVAVISPYRSVRDEVKTNSHNFMEVYVNAPLAVCESRDVKGLYAAARDGKIKGFTGVDDPYEIPLNPDVICLSDRESVDESVSKIVNVLDKYLCKINYPNP